MMYLGSGVATINSRNVIFAALALCSGIAPSSAAARCDLRPPGGRAELSLPLHPLTVATLRRHCALLVTLSDDSDPDNGKGAIAVLQPVQGSLALTFLLDLPTQPVGVAFTSDESVAVVAGFSQIYFADVDALLGGKTSAIRGTLEYDHFAGTVSVALSRGEHLLFASDEAAATVTLIDFAAARASGFTNAPVLGRISVDEAPTILEMAADGAHVFLPAQTVKAQSKPPILCADHPGGEAVNPVGAILTIDVAATQASPGGVVPSRTYAGCSPVRMKLSQDGRVAFVTDREENLLRVMDATKIVRGEPDALVTTVSVGPAPIGVALVDNDRLALVTNSNRWAEEQTSQTVSVIDIAGDRRHKPVVIGNIPVGVFPRDLAVSHDGRTVVVSNFGSKSLTLLDVSKLRKLISPAKSN